MGKTVREIYIQTIGVVGAILIGFSHIYRLYYFAQVYWVILIYANRLGTISGDVLYISSENFLLFLPS